MKNAAQANDPSTELRVALSLSKGDRARDPQRSRAAF
jgi:hypothetical protein